MTTATDTVPTMTPPLSSTGTSNANPTQGLTNIGYLLPVTSKYRLPDFDYACPEVWFAASDVIFRDNNVQTEQAKFSALLQRLYSTRLKNILTIIADQDELQPYTRARQILLNLYAQSAEQKFEQLLGQSGGAVKEGLKPSLLLDEIRRLGNGIIDDEALIKKIWMQRLPQNVWSHVASSEQKLPLDELVRIADVVSNIVNPTPAAVTAVAVQPTVAPTPDPLIANLVSAITVLTNEVSAIKVTMNERSRSRNRDGSPNSRRDRSRSSTPYRRYGYYVKNDVCTYHFRYGNNARRCIKGCKHYKPKNSEN
jgi:hypothetical protein